MFDLYLKYQAKPTNYSFIQNVETKNSCNDNCWHFKIWNKPDK